MIKSVKYTPGGSRGKLKKLRTGMAAGGGRRRGSGDQGPGEGGGRLQSARARHASTICGKPRRGTGPPHGKMGPVRGDHRDRALPPVLRPPGRGPGSGAEPLAGGRVLVRNRRHIRRRYGHATPDPAPDVGEQRGTTTPRSATSTDKTSNVTAEARSTAREKAPSAPPPLRRSERVCRPTRRLIEEI